MRKANKTNGNYGKRRTFSKWRAEAHSGACRWGISFAAAPKHWGTVPRASGSLGVTLGPRSACVQPGRRDESVLSQETTAGSSTVTRHPAPAPKASVSPVIYYIYVALLKTLLFPCETTCVQTFKMMVPMYQVDNGRRERGECLKRCGALLLEALWHYGF